MSTEDELRRELAELQDELTAAKQEVETWRVAAEGWRGYYDDQLRQTQHVGGLWAQRDEELRECREERDRLKAEVLKLKEDWAQEGGDRD